MPWSRALRATAETPRGPLAVYVAHLPSVRVSPAAGFTTGARDAALARLTGFIRAEDVPGRWCWATSTDPPTTGRCVL